MSPLRGCVKCFCTNLKGLHPLPMLSPLRGFTKNEMNKKITTQKWSGIAFTVKNKLRQSLELWRSLTNYFILIRRSRIGKISVRKSLGLVGQSLTNEPNLKLTHSQTL